MRSIYPERPLLLLVDDLPSNLHVLVSCLREDYRIKTAINGQKALELVADNDPPQLILLDVMMPGMSGIDVMRTLKSQASTSEIPVMFVTADSSEQNHIEGLELGAIDYINKPIVAPVLLARVRNVIERQRIFTQLKLAAHVFEHSGEAILISDRYNRIVDVNPAFVMLTGYEPKEVIGKDPALLRSGYTPENTFTTMFLALQTRDSWQAEVWNRHKDGSILVQLVTVSTVRDASNQIEYYLANYVDISSQKENESRLQNQAQHDSLTGLPNRLHLNVSFNQALATARRRKQSLAVFFLDLNQFKAINDNYGHHVGDQILMELGKRLRDLSRESDLLARLGGDEFVMVLNIGSSDGQSPIDALAQKLVESLSKVYQLAEHELVAPPSVGIAVFPQHGNDMETLLRLADHAMYQSKQRGQGSYLVYGSVEE